MLIRGELQGFRHALVELGKVVVIGVVVACFVKDALYRGLEERARGSDRALWIT